MEPDRKESVGAAPKFRGVNLNLYTDMIGIYSSDTVSRPSD